MSSTVFLGEEYKIFIERHLRKRVVEKYFIFVDWRVSIAETSILTRLIPLWGIWRAMHGQDVKLDKVKEGVIWQVIRPIVRLCDDAMGEVTVRQKGSAICRHLVPGQETEEAVGENSHFQISAVVSFKIKAVLLNSSWWGYLPSVSGI